MNQQSKVRSNKSEKLRVNSTECKHSEGITLIALIITIVVLLILAMVSINLVINGGILSKTKDATNSYVIAEEKERIQLAYTEYKMNKTLNGTANLTVEGANVVGDETTGWTITFTDTGNVYELSADGTIEGAGNSETNVNLGGFETDGEGTITGYNGTASNLTIPSTINGETITTIGVDAFYGNTNLTSVTIEEGITYIAPYSFYECSNLETVVLPSTVSLYVDYGFVSAGPPAVFANCLKLKNLTIDENNPYYCCENGVIYNKDKTVLYTYLYGNTETSFAVPISVTKIGRFAFYANQNLKTVYIPSTVTSISSYVFPEANITDIYCEAESKPDGWDTNWFYNESINIHWGEEWKEE